ncbi:MAG: hypothetical protein AAB767_01655, partial [Patescibacteria group bacterium]
AAGGNPVDAVQGYIKKRFDGVKKMLPSGVDLNVFVSLLNPVLDESAEAVADKASGYVIKYPWLVSKWAASLIGGFAALIENAGDEQDSEPMRVAFKKAADWFETFGHALGKHATGEKAKGTEMSPELRKALAKIDEAWLEHADLILVGTAPANLPDMKALLAQEAEARHDIRHITLFGPEKKPESKKPGVPFMKQVADVAKSAGKTANAQLVVLNTHLAPLAADAKTKADMEETRNRLRRTSTAGSSGLVRFAKAVLLFPVTVLTFPFRRR